MRSPLGCGGQVLFDRTAADSIDSWTDTAIQVSVPYVAPATATVTVKPAGKSCAAPTKIQVESGGCVAAGTRVSLADGTFKAIEAIVPGEKVFAIDSENKEVKAARVKRLLVHRGEAYTLNTLRLSRGQTLRVTDNHPVLVVAAI